MRFVLNHGLNRKTQLKKKNYFIRVSMYLTKVLIGTLFLRLQMETEPPFSVVIRTTRKFSSLQITFISQLF